MKAKGSRWVLTRSEHRCTVRFDAKEAILGAVDGGTAFGLQPDKAARR